MTAIRGATSAGANPLRDPLDRRLPRIPEPCALVIFGVTGDLARKKLLPAIYDLANRGLLPPGFVVLGFARRDWGDGDFEDDGPRGRPGARPHAVAGGGVGPAGRQHQVRARLVRRRRRLRQARRRPWTSCATAHGIQGNAAFYLSIPPAAFPVVLKQLDRTGMADNEQVRRLAPGGGGEAVRPRPGLGPRAQRPGRRRVHRAGRVPHRPLPGQGDGPEHPGAALRQRRCSSRCGTPTTSTRCRSPWPRTSASAAGPASTTPPAPPATCCRTTCCSCSRWSRWRSRPASTPTRSGPRSSRCCGRSRCPTTSRTGTVRGQYLQGWVAGERVVGYLEEEDVPPDSTTETYVGGPARHPEPALGRGAVLHPGRQADAAPGHRDRGAVQEGAAPAVPRRPTWSCSATTSW